MSNKLEWIDLDWESYKILDNKLREDYDEPFSGLTYLSWRYYGIKIRFSFFEESILLWGFIEKDFFNIEREDIINNKIIKNNISSIIIRPFTNKDNIDKIINIQINEINSITNETILLENFYEKDLEKIKEKEFLWKWESNYIFLTEKLKFFKGKALQKKRNLLNFFNNNFLVNSKIKKITKEDINEIKKFINSNHDDIIFSENEINFYNEIFNNFNSENMYGSILYFNENIIGITLGYLRNNYYEIYIEKCVKRIKGAYQYLLSQNLINNNINCSFVDRQDGASIENLIKSKKSYKPIKIYTRDVYMIKKIH